MPKDVPKNVGRLAKIAAERLHRHVVAVALALPTLIGESSGNLTSEAGVAENLGRIGPREAGGEAKVPNLEPAIGGDEHIGRFEIEVKDIVRVDVVDALQSEKAMF